MKSYLSLITISAKVHKRQNRMTLLCIIFAVFMVTAVFSMAEMGARMEQARLAAKHGGFSFTGLFDSQMGQSLLLTAFVLFLLILIAGVLMIASSMNSSVAQRMKFFGMMRCIGMSKQQIIRFVRLEALNWCKTAVPIGLLLGIVTTWGLCAILRFLVGEEFSNIPLFGVSMVGIISGIAVGLITVWIAAGAPAKRAARVSPIAAVSGNAESDPSVRRPLGGAFGRIETALGIHHAVSAKKTLFLMTGSFALSIILFLSFSVLIDFVTHLLPQSAATSDIDISSADEANTINREWIDIISGMEGVKRVYGRQSSFDIPVRVGGTAYTSRIDLISFDDFDLSCLKKDGMLREGSSLSRVYGDSSYVLATWDPDSPWEIGDKIHVGNEELEIAGLLKLDPFRNDGLTDGKLTLIVSGETFLRLTGITDYCLLMVQTAGDITDEEVAAIRDAVGNHYDFKDKRDLRTAGTYLAFVFCIYSFLAMIALVAVLNIVNSISMSVSARMKQYGAMLAVGMDKYQMTKMIAVEAFTYAFWGCVVGCAAGLPLHRLLYNFLVAAHFRYTVWRIPLTSLAIIFGFVVFAAAIAVYAPAKRIRNMSVTETLNEL